MGCRGCGTKKRRGPPVALDDAPAPLNLDVVSDIRPNPNLYPDGGYFFIEGDGTQFRGESWRDLIAKVRSYRERNKKPAGDPEADVYRQYCTRMPQHCRSNAPVRPPGPHHSMSLNQRVMQWCANILSWMRAHKIPRVPDDEARRRAEICARCPRHKPLVQSCQQCLTTLTHARKAVLNSVPSQHQGLMACEALGEDLPITVHIQQPMVPADRVPPECWRK